MVNLILVPFHFNGAGDGDRSCLTRTLLLILLMVNLTFGLDGLFAPAVMLRVQTTMVLAWRVCCSRVSDACDAAKGPTPTGWDWNVCESFALKQFIARERCCAEEVSDGLCLAVELFGCMEVAMNSLRVRVLSVM